MKSLIGVRTNIYYTKEEGQEIKHHELVLLLDTPQYSRSNAGEIIRERAIEETRFTVTDKGLEGLIDLLSKLKDVKEEELI